MGEELKESVCNRILDYYNQHDTDVMLLAAYFFMDRLELNDDIEELLHKSFSDASNDIAVMNAAYIIDNYIL